ncbi:uncharacterized protein si:dkey-260g12.1 [Trichomycterus rosablanca]|uniref:uncharacterized protein si:dkey-260g12.1 n=1 Tax=Trichomycterus rosablanca TaxID=2290929 RepID=UPI002F35E58F
MALAVLRIVALVVFLGGLTSSLPLEVESRRCQGSNCKLCPAVTVYLVLLPLPKRTGTYLKSCCDCSACPEDTFTDKANREKSCHPCFKDCNAALNLQVVKSCSNTSDVQCECMAGFVCSKREHNRCVKCQRQPQTSATPTPTPTPTETPSSHQSGWVKQCSVMNQKEGTSTGPSEIHEPISHLPWDKVQPAPTSTSPSSGCTTNQPVQTEQAQQATGNLGPLHIYGAGTVFVSLMNQFGLNGDEKDEEEPREKHLNQTELHSPTWSTCPLSTEERNRDSGYISFPSQEQGKECHISKEEGL